MRTEMKIYSDLVMFLCGIGLLLLGYILLVTKELKSIKYGILDFEGHYILVGSVFMIAGSYIVVLTTLSVYKKYKKMDNKNKKV